MKNHWAISGHDKMWHVPWVRSTCLRTWNTQQVLTFLLPSSTSFIWCAFVVMLFILAQHLLEVTQWKFDDHICISFRLWIAILPIYPSINMASFYLLQRFYKGSFMTMCKRERQYTIASRHIYTRSAKFVSRAPLQTAADWWVLTFSTKKKF